MSASDPAHSSRKAVGIDLGTTFCAIAHIDAYGKPQIIPHAESERITPSFILFDVLKPMQPINKPTAAPLASDIDRLDTDQTVFVFDHGGGTFDVTIMKIEAHHIRMLASNGDHRLGGKDWDDVIVNWVADEFDK